MHLSTLVEMLESGFDDRILLGAGERAVTGIALADLVRRGAGAITDGGAPSAVVYVGENHALLPVAVLAAAWAGVPFVPLNYRAEDRQLDALIARHPGALVLADEGTALRLSGRSSVFSEWVGGLGAAPLGPDPAVDDDAVAVVLYTSGTTSEPKSALLRHRHLMAYLLGSVEFASAEVEEAMLVSVPPYHVAGVANMLSNLFAGRRLVYLERFGAAEWLDTVRLEGITHAMVVPTMLARIVDRLDGAPADAPTLRVLSYGGAKTSERVLLAALRAFPDTGFVNAYGLTETASTIAVLGPADHRAALESDDPDVRRRLTSVGRVLPTVEIEIRGDGDRPVAPGVSGIVHLRGEQVSGEYATGSVLDADGWFCTRDLGHLDPEGFLYIEGRADDTIIRGGENIAPAEIEEVILRRSDVREVCVVGVPDDEWGQRIVAVVVPSGEGVDPDEIREAVRAELRGSKTPDVVLVRATLPHTETGKMLRRLVAADVAGELPDGDT